MVPPIAVPPKERKKPRSHSPAVRGFFFQSTSIIAFLGRVRRAEPSSDQTPAVVGFFSSTSKPVLMLWIIRASPADRSQLSPATSTMSLRASSGGYFADIGLRLSQLVAGTHSLRGRFP